MAEKELNSVETEVKSTLSQKYPNKSKKAKDKKNETPKDTEEINKKIVSGKVTKKKKNALTKVGDELVEDSAPSVFSYIFHEVAIPALKELIVDMVSGGVEKLFFGTETHRSGKHGGSKDKSYVSYTSYYDKKRSREEREYRRPRERFHSEDYVLETRMDAYDVRDQLLDMLDAYEVVTIADFKDLIGVSHEYTDQNWGWTNLRSSSVRAVRGGFVVSLPSPISVV